MTVEKLLKSISLRYDRFFIIETIMRVFNYRGMVLNKKTIWFVSIFDVINSEEIISSIIEDVVFNSECRSSLSLFSHKLARILQLYKYSTKFIVYCWLLDLFRSSENKRLKIEADLIGKHLESLTPMSYYDYLKKFINDHIN